MLFPVTITPVMSANPDYSANDIIGTSMLFTDFFLKGRAGTLKLVSAFASDLANVGPAVTVTFFNGALAGGTYTDNAALVLSAADKSLLCGYHKIAAADYQTIGGIKVVHSGAIDKGIVGTEDLGVVVQADGAYNGASVADLVITLWFDDGM